MTSATTQKKTGTVTAPRPHGFAYTAPA